MKFICPQQKIPERGDKKSATNATPPHHNTTNLKPHAEDLRHNVPVNSKTTHPPGQTPGHLTFLKNFGRIPRYAFSLDGQMPHPLKLQRGSNRSFKCTYSVINNWLMFWLTIDQNRKAVVVLQHTFTDDKKSHPSNRPAEREAVNIWIWIHMVYSIPSRHALMK